MRERVASAEALLCHAYSRRGQPSSSEWARWVEEHFAEYAGKAGG
jgi:hypothetical protein